MTSDLETLKSIFLADDMDSDEYQDNLAQVEEWEKLILVNQELQSWQEHDITKRIMTQASESYTEISLRLASERDISAEERVALFAKQDAMHWIMNLASGDPKGSIADIEKKIKIAINATK